MPETAADASVVRPLRADAARNRERLLAVASEAFSTRGVDVPLEDIARQADVGIGTLYRHFPNRDNLVEAVYRRDVERLSDRAGTLLEQRSADDALATWMRDFVGYVARKRGMAATLKSAAGDHAELFAYVHGRLTGAIQQLVAAAIDAGSIRSDMGSEDVLRALRGICLGADDGAGQAQARRLVDLVMDGLRYRASAGVAG